MTPDAKKDKQPAAERPLPHQSPDPPGAPPRPAAAPGRLPPTQAAPAPAVRAARPESSGKTAWLKALRPKAAQPTPPPAPPASQPVRPAAPARAEADEPMPPPGRTRPETSRDVMAAALEATLPQPEVASPKRPAPAEKKGKSAPAAPGPPTAAPRRKAAAQASPPAPAPAPEPVQEAQPAPIVAEESGPRRAKRAAAQDEMVGQATPTRTVGRGEATAVDKAAGSSGRRDIMTGRSALEEAAHRRAVTPKAKLPEFPAPASERPEELVREEKRREAIRWKEETRRAAALEGKDEEQQKKLMDEWVLEDALEYHTDPDDVELEVYPLRAPYAYVQIIRNTRTHATLYHVIEPKLNHDEQLLLTFIEQTLVDVLDLQPSDLDKEEISVYIRKKFESVMEDYSVRLGDEESTEAESKDRLLYYVFRDFIGEGPIDIFMHDPMIEDISCDGPHQPIFIYHRKYESLTTTVRWRGHEVLDSFVIRLAQRAGKHVSIAEPILDATMRDGSRLQATLAKEVSTFGSSFTIRKFREVPFSPVDLVRFGTMSSQMLAYLWMVIANRQSAIYSGGTASGKTTAINAIMLFIPPAMKVITIEDTRELNIPQPNWIAGLTRGGFGPRDAHGRQAGEIDMFQLLKNALRQRPEYIIVGEVRGAEAYNLFQAMATGHAAYGTMHADSVDAVIHRLESDPINIPRALLEALDVVAVQIQTRVGGKRVRRTKQITEIVGLDPNTREILTNEVFHWEPATDEFIFSGVSYSLERIAAENGLDTDQVLAEMDDRRRVIEWMVKQQIREYKIIADIINAFFFDKTKIMGLVQEDLPWA
ncbi:MAG: ATPase, T2SS/T4P/T4SS family [bacterium]